MSATKPVRPASGTAPTPQRRRAWLSLLLFPVTFVAAFVVGEGLVTLLGYSVGGESPPVGVMLAAAIPALAVFSVPAALATYFARRAALAGEPHAWMPAYVGLGVAGVFVLQNVLAFLLVILFG